MTMDPTPLFTYIDQYIDLTNQERELLLSKISFRNYLKGQYVVQQGDICRFESFVVKGCLRTFHLDMEGNEHVVMFAIENWWTGDMGSFMTQTPASFNVQCLEKCQLIQISHADLEILYREIPKLERLFRIIIQKAFIASERRIARNFSLSAKDRYEQFIRQYPEINNRVPQYMVASYLGITKEFLSKIRNQFVTSSS